MNRRVVAVTLVLGALGLSACGGGRHEGHGATGASNVTSAATTVPAPTPEVDRCVADIRNRAEALKSLLAEGESIESVDDVKLARLCRETILPGEAQTRPTAAVPPPTPVSAKCDTAMSKVAKEPDSSAAQSLFKVTLSACATADEWLAALRRYPSAIGVIGPEQISYDDLKIVCFSVEGDNTPVCSDARAKGWL